jgi:hypothetical protein
MYKEVADFKAFKAYGAATAKEEIFLETEANI